MPTQRKKKPLLHTARRCEVRYRRTDRKRERKENETLTECV